MKTLDKAENIVFRPDTPYFLNSGSCKKDTLIILDNVSLVFYNRLHNKDELIHLFY